MSTTSDTDPLDYKTYFEQTSQYHSQWYDDLTDPDLQERQARPVDMRRVKQLAMKQLEQNNDSTDMIQQETLVEFDSDDDFDINKEDDTNEMTSYGSFFEKYNPQMYSSFSKSLMSRMGYNVDDPDLFAKNAGLGKENQGIAAPIQADMTRMRTNAGLGAISTTQLLRHQYRKPEIELKIPVDWITKLDEELLIVPPVADLEDFSYSDDKIINSPNSWCELRVKTVSYTDPIYCPLPIQLELFGTKSEFDNVANDIFLDARNRSNPYELLKREYFQNRAALKMAELDAECGHIFTNPPCYQIENDQYASPFYWGDVCAGPGGFSEFMSTVVKWKGKGFGFTLRAENDFQLDKFNQCSTPQTFKGFYGDGTGDVTRTSNLISWSNEVVQGTGGKMLHVMMADGGFSVAGKENYQELLSRQLLLCQCIAALVSLRKGGVCVIKMFDTFLRFTIDCIYLMRLSFESVAIVKPHQSRPANSERYLVCKGLFQQGGVNHPVASYMLRVNDMMNQIDPLHQQSGLVQNAESKPLLFMSAGVLTGAVLDGNHDVDENGQIFDLTEVELKQKQLDAENETKLNEIKQLQKKRQRISYNDDDNNDTNDYMDMDDYDDIDQHNPEVEIFIEYLDDEFIIESIPLPSDFELMTEYGLNLDGTERGFVLNNNSNMNNDNEQPEIQHHKYHYDKINEIEMKRTEYGEPVPPEPRMDRQLLLQQQKYVSAAIYTDKYKSGQKHNKSLLKNHQYNPENDDDENEQYTTNMKDIIVTGQTIYSLVPMKYHDPEFQSYIKQWNESYAVQQIQWLRRILEYIQDPSLPSDDQDRIRIQCLQRWKIVTDQKNESGDGMVHWSPNWGRLWADPMAISQQADSIKSVRFLKEFTKLIQDITSASTSLSNSFKNNNNNNSQTIVTSSMANDKQLQALLDGKQSMSAFNAVVSKTATSNINHGRNQQMNQRHTQTMILQNSEHLFGSTQRFIQQYILYFNFCRFVYYNTHCIDMTYALQLIGLDIQYLEYMVRLEDLKNPTIFKALQNTLADILTLWLKYINKQKPILTPPASTVIADENSLLESRDKYQTTSTNWVALPILPHSKRCLALTLSPYKKHTSFTRTLFTSIAPHQCITLASPRKQLGELLSHGDQTAYKYALHPLLQLVYEKMKNDHNNNSASTNNNNDSTSQQTTLSKDLFGDSPSERTTLLNGSKSIFTPYSISLSDPTPMQQLISILKNEHNTRREERSIKDSIQHDLSTGVLKFLPGDMIFDTFINIDIVPSLYIKRAIQSHQRLQSPNANLSPQELHQLKLQSMLPTPRIRNVLFDAWSLPHQTTTMNPEKFMYERLRYMDRYQNLKVLADTMRIKEPILSITNAAGGNNNSTQFRGQEIKTQKLLHHTTYQLSSLNSNNPNAIPQTSSLSTTNTGNTTNNINTVVSIDKLLSNEYQPSQFPSIIDLTRALDLNEPSNLRQLHEQWNLKLPPLSTWEIHSLQKHEIIPKTRDNLYLFQKGHKLYSISIWFALFTMNTRPLDSLRPNMTDEQLQQKLKLFPHLTKQSQQDIDEVYKLLKNLQQNAILDAIGRILIPQQVRKR